MPSKFNADIAVVGGGPAGSAAAIYLSRHGAKVALIESDSAQPDRRVRRPGERLPALAKLTMDEFGLDWSGYTLPEGGSVSLWAGTEPIEQSEPRPELAALTVDRRKLDADLLAAAEKAGATVLPNTRFQSLEGKAGEWVLACRDANSTLEVQAPFVIDATGRGAKVLHALNIPILRTDAMVGLLRWWTGCPAELRGRFWIEAVDRGWVYATVTPGGSGMAGYLTMRPTLNRSFSNTWEEALSQTQLIRAALPRDVTWSDVAIFSAAPGRASQMIGPGWAAVGEAAYHCDPIQGQGVLQGWQNAQALAALLASDASLAPERQQEYLSYLEGVHAEHIHNRLRVYMDSDRLGDHFTSLIGRPD